MTFFRSIKSTKKPRGISAKWVDYERNPPSGAQIEVADGPSQPARRSKRLKSIGKKGLFWLFCSQTWNLFFLKIGLERRCEACDGSAYCGILTPAHTIRRADIRTDDWYHALRVVALGDACHLRIDSLGRREAEPVLEKIRSERNRRLGLTEAKIEALLLQCAGEIQAEDALKGEKARFQNFHVTFE